MVKRNMRFGRAIPGIEIPAELLSIYLGIYLGFMCIKPLVEKRNEYYSRPRIINQSKVETIIEPSEKIAIGIRAYDYGNDGLIDKVQTLSFGYRISFSKWNDLDPKNSLFQRVQKEYTEMLNSP